MTIKSFLSASGLGYVNGYCERQHETDEEAIDACLGLANQVFSPVVIIVVMVMSLLLGNLLRRISDGMFGPDIGIKEQHINIHEKIREEEESNLQVLKKSSH
eukprot:scaffold15475_cov47-Attheya_sp.AAC.3